MKRINHTLSTLTLLICFSSCHNEYIPGPKLPEGSGFEGIINYEHLDLELLEGSESGSKLISMFGTGFSNLPELEFLSMENSHILIYEKNVDVIYIKKGKFKLSGKGKVAIYGIYEGIGTYKNNIFSSELEFTILGGHALTNGANGNFTGKLHSIRKNPVIWVMNFNGLINLVVHEK